ncbi:MAG TPA: DUF58 domain-containing protein [Candidatus Dormibacteraeota bacterium]|nr:DUF58 domain-containing protein [Candidatus Dormibacteraeota bacterium]
MSAPHPLGEHLRRRLLRARAHGPAGEGAPLLRGEGLEFAELRAYAEGDDPRRIDWAATARSGELQSRVMLEESGLHLCCAVDTGPRMLLGRARPLRDAALAYGSLWLSAARDRDRVRLVLGSRPVDPGTLRGPRAAALALRRLAAPDAAMEHVIDGATLAYLDATLAPGTALLLVGECYAMEPLLEDAHLARLPLRRHAVARIARDPWSDGLPLRGAALLRDAAGGQPRTLWFDRGAAARHAAACAAREARIVERMRSLGWRVRLFDETATAADLVA